MKGNSNDVDLMRLQIFSNEAWEYFQQKDQDELAKPSGTDTKDRIITISDKEITVTNFFDGGNKTLNKKATISKE